MCIFPLTVNLLNGVRKGLMYVQNERSALRSILLRANMSSNALTWAMAPLRLIKRGGSPPCPASVHGIVKVYLQAIGIASLL